MTRKGEWGAESTVAVTVDKAQLSHVRDRQDRVTFKFAARWKVTPPHSHARKNWTLRGCDEGGHFLHPAVASSKHLGSVYSTTI